MTQLKPFDAKTEFERFCGSDVKYLRHEGPPSRNLCIYYSIEGQDRELSVNCHLMDGTNIRLRNAARRCAKLAYDDAYRRTGKREADMNMLLSRRTV